MSKSSSSFKITVPNEPNFLCVDYPGYVENIDKALQTLGGEESVSKAFNRQPTLQLNIRQGQPYSRSLHGDRCRVSRLVLRVRKHKLKEDQQEQKYEVDCIGKIDYAYQFNGLSDFQFIPDDRATGTQLSQEQELINNNEPCQENVPVNLIPPLICNVDAAQEYAMRGFYSKPTTYQQECPFVHAISADSPFVLQLPEQEEIVGFKDNQKETSAVIGGLLQTRPIWNYEMLVSKVEDRLKPYVQEVLYVFAYTFKSGPWSGLLIKRGLDPREQSEQRLYQRVPNASNNAQYFSQSSSVTSSALQYEKIVQFKEAPDQNVPICLFDMIHHNKLLFQEFTDLPALESYDEHSGWFDKDDLDRIGHVVQQQFEIIIEKRDNLPKRRSPRVKQVRFSEQVIEIPEISFTDNIDIDEEDNEQNIEEDNVDIDDEDKEQNIEEGKDNQGENIKELNDATERLQINNQGNLMESLDTFLQQFEDDDMNSFLQMDHDLLIKDDNINNSNLPTSFGQVTDESDYASDQNNHDPFL